MSGNREWPNWEGVPTRFNTCIYAYGQFWWAYEAAASTDFQFFAVPTAANAFPSHATGIPARAVAYWRVRPQPATPAPATPAPALYSIVGVSPVRMFWVKQPYGPLESLRAPYEEILERVKRLAEKCPDTTYTVVKVCAEVRTPPKPTIEVKEY